jgi:cation:H+ antiporter
MIPPLHHIKGYNLKLSGKPLPVLEDLPLPRQVAAVASRLRFVIPRLAVNVAPSLLNFDMEVMLVVAVACLPVFFTGYSIARWEGWLFLGCYAAYIAYLIMDAAGHDALPAFSQVMLMFVLPLLAVTVSVIAFRSLIRQR